MGLQTTVALVAALGFFAYHFIHDRFASLNRFADSIEENVLPGLGLGWFTYQKLGCPISWVHHAIWTWLGGAIVGSAVWQLGGDYGTGFLSGTAVMLVFYLIRETLDFLRNYRKSGSLKGAFVVTLSHPFVGYGIDGVGDVVGPALVFRYAAARVGLF